MDRQGIKTDRRQVYGDPKENHEGIAQIWASLLQPHAARIAAGVPVPPHVVALLMVALKLNRMRLVYHEDNYDDMRNYLDFAQEWQGEKYHYLAGPMRGYPDENAEAFITGSERIKSVFGCKNIITPQDNTKRFWLNPNEHPTPESFKELFSRDVDTAIRAECVWVLPGWGNSKGTLAEILAAQVVGVPIRSVETGEYIYAPESESTNPKTQGPEQVLDQGTPDIEPPGDSGAKPDCQGDGIDQPPGPYRFTIQIPSKQDEKDS